MSRAEPGAGGAGCEGPCSAWNLAAAARERRQRARVRARQCGAARTCERFRSLRRLRRNRRWRRRRSRRRRRRLRRGGRGRRRRRRRRHRRRNRRLRFRVIISFSFSVNLRRRRDRLADAARLNGGGPHRRHGRWRRRRRRLGLRRGWSIWRRRAALAVRLAVLFLQQAGHCGVELAAALRARQTRLVPLAWRRTTAAASGRELKCARADKTHRPAPPRGRRHTPFRRTWGTPPWRRKGERLLVCLKGTADDERLPALASR